MKKTIPAFLAAALITVLLASAMLFVGQDALAASASTQTVAKVDDQSATIVALQNQLAQYQSQEEQYKLQLNQAVDRITGANQQIELANQKLVQYQSLIAQLQASGLIIVNADGTITINAPQAGGGFR